MDIVTLTLPYPPSTNKYYRYVGGRPIISKEGRAFRENVIATCFQSTFQSNPLLAGLAVEIQVFPPDRGRRDLDNVLKATLDAMQHAGVYADDSQIHRLVVERAACTPGGKLRIQITEFTQCHKSE